MPRAGQTSTGWLIVCVKAHGRGRSPMAQGQTVFKWVSCRDGPWSRRADCFPQLKFNER